LREIRSSRCASGGGQEARPAPEEIEDLAKVIDNAKKKVKKVEKRRR